LDAADTLADLDDFSGDLMPQHMGKGDNGWRDLALDDFDVGVAEAAGFNLEKDLAWAGLWPVPVHGFQGLVISFEEPSFHGGRSFLMLVFSHNQITDADELNECRMSNNEFRMTKFNDFDILLRKSPSRPPLQRGKLCSLLVYPSFTKRGEGRFVLFGVTLSFHLSRGFPPLSGHEGLRFAFELLRNLRRSYGLSI
jgi:hypothetical protein